MSGSRLPKRRRRERGRRAAPRRLSRSPWVVGVIIVVALVVVIGVIAVSQITQGSEEATPIVPTVPASERVCAGGGVPVEGRTCGDEDAPVKMVEFSNYQCSWCGRFAQETEVDIQREYIATGKVQLEFRNMAAEGTASGLAAEAAECASEQGEFWAYHDMLFENQQNFDAEVLKEFAEELGLDQEAFDECLDSHRHRQLVIDETTAAREAGVQGTPSFFVNDEFVRGYRSFEDFRPIIERALREAGVETTPEAGEPTPSTQEEGP